MSARNVTGIQSLGKVLNVLYFYYTTAQLFDDPVFYRKEAEVLSSELRQICKLFVGVCREARAGWLTVS